MVSKKTNVETVICAHKVVFVAYLYYFTVRLKLFNNKIIVENVYIFRFINKALEILL